MSFPLSKLGVFILVVCSILFGACSNHFSLQKRHYRKGFYFSQHSKMKSTPCLTKAHQVKQTVPTDINTSTPTRVSVYTESITCNPINTNHQSSASSLNQNKIQTRIKTIAESSAIPFQHKIQLPQRKSRINMHKSQKDGAIILLDLLLIFLGLAAGLFFFFVALFIGTGGFSSAGPSSTGDTNLVYFFILLALFCIGAPFKKLINDL